MKKFLVLYLMPVAGLEKWKNTDPAITKPAEEKMRMEWGNWMRAHAAHIIETAGAGKTKRVTSEGIVDTKNELMLYSLMEAESHEAAAELFKDNPHLQIPESSIEIMEANVLPLMH